MGSGWRVRAGPPWRDVPERYGSWSAVSALFCRWQNLAYLRRRGIAATIPDQGRPARQLAPEGVEGRPATGLRHRTVQTAACREMRYQPTQRNRAVATRYDKLAVRYEATIQIAAINEWL